MSATRTSAPPRLLFVANDMLGPIVGGGRQRCWKIIDRARSYADVDVVAIAPEADFIRDRDRVARAPGVRIQAYQDETPHRPDLLRHSAAATAHITAMEKAFGTYDAIHVESFYVLPVLPPWLVERVVLAEQNIESHLVRQAVGLAERGSAGTWPLHANGVDPDQVHEAEESAWSRVRTVVTLSPEDFDEVRRRRPEVDVRLVANGWDHLGSPKPSSCRSGVLREPRLLYFGDYDYLPNLDAAMWLATSVIPEIRRRLPGAQIEVGGINAPDGLVSIVQNTAGARWIGYIPDLVEKFGDTDIVVCPTRVGGGVRVKISETLHQGRLLVSTSTGGSRWIPDEVRPAVLFADTPSDLADAVFRLATDPGERQRRVACLAAGRSALPTWDMAEAQLRQLWGL